MKRLLVAWLIGAASSVISGCSVYMAFTQPPAIDTEALDASGVSRDIVIERLGDPTDSTINADGSREDIFKYYEGSSTRWKIGRGIFHLAADILTLALWEVVATPMEFTIRGDKITARGDFDNADRLLSFRVLKREEKPLENMHRSQEEG